jgi:uncharacterized protein (TIGR02217 family)
MEDIQMGHWLAPPGAARINSTLKRFDARFWTINFPRPMMAAAVTTGPNALRIEAVFIRADDLAGLIWEAGDRHDHALLAYAEARDFRRCRLAFRWRSGGIRALDEVDGPTLTIEGRDAEGTAQSWYVRLWNYADGTPEDAAISLDFDALAGGWEADVPVWAGDVERLFISLVAPDYSGADEALDAPAEGWAALDGIACDGSGSTLSIGDTIVPEHRLRIATGYDDLNHLTPARLLHNIVRLGYRGTINHYVGMSHYFRLADGLAASGLNAPCRAWHADFLARAKALGFEMILSLSYELLDLHCPEDWKQRAANGDPALTGWEPPSTLLSPASEAAMAWLAAAARGFAALAADAGLPVRVQLGEPWWWVMPDGRICLYDAAATAAFAPVPIEDVRAALDGAQQATLDAAGTALAASTTALAAAVRDEAPDAELLLLLYLPTLLDGAEIRRANAPLAWAMPAFDVLQLEDYGWVTSGRTGASGQGAALMAARLGYPVAQQHYFAGFVRDAEALALWTPIAAAAAAAARRGTAETFVWALPQVLRDGFVHFEPGEDDVDAFDDVRFPIGLGREVSVEPHFSTAIATNAGGGEQRNAEWADARLHFDAGPGLRGEADLHALIAFFRARRGAAIGFRLEDPFDNSSQAMVGTPGAADQALGIGDGARTDFALVKHYGGQLRRITRPVAETVRVSVDGVEQVDGWALVEKGTILFDEAPADDAEIAAGFRFDVPVRFAEDRLAVSRATFAAGDIPTVPLIEIRE